MKDKTKQTVKHLVRKEPEKVCLEGCKPDPKLFGQAFDKLLKNKERLHRIVFGNKDLVEY